MLSYGVVDDRLGEAVELFFDRCEAERVVEDWDRDEPDQAGLLRVEPCCSSSARLPGWSTGGPCAMKHTFAS